MYVVERNTWMILRISSFFLLHLALTHVHKHADAEKGPPKRVCALGCVDYLRKQSRSQLFRQLDTPMPM